MCNIRTKNQTIGIHPCEEEAKNYDSTNKIVLRFLEGEQIRQLPVKSSHKLYVLRYLASKFEAGKEYTEAEVNAIIDQWHTFGDYFILRRELIDSGLLKRLPNGSKYWRDIHDENTNYIET